MIELGTTNNNYQCSICMLTTSAPVSYQCRFTTPITFRLVHQTVRCSPTRTFVPFSRRVAKETVSVQLSEGPSSVALPPLLERRILRRASVRAGEETSVHQVSGHGHVSPGMIYLTMSTMIPNDLIPNILASKIW